MNILIFDNYGNLSFYVPFHSISNFEVLVDAIKCQFADGHLLRNDSPSAFVIGNSARRLIHALVTGADQVHLGESQFLSERQYENWKAAPVSPVAGCLPEGAPLN